MAVHTASTTRRTSGPNAAATADVERRPVLTPEWSPRPASFPGIPSLPGSMPKLLVFQHVASEPLGHLDPLLRNSGFRIRYVNFGREPAAQPDIRRYDGLVVLGGPMNVDQVEQFPHLATELAVIRETVTAG